ncbi:MAG: beta-xylosidase [Chloroflexota bacterium]|nr:beta-xylosidase [Chloroflexota bacterium]
MVSHWTERYDVEEVRRWFFEVWNEPDREQFWSGTQEEYFKFYRHTVEAIKEVDDALVVGGPATSQDKWIEAFLDYCGKNNVPVDFVSTHGYPNDPVASAGGDPKSQLAKIDLDIMQQKAQEAHRQAAGRPLYYTEWNTSSNLGSPLHDQPFAAAFIIKIIMSVYGLVEGYSFWTFSDIFEEQGLRSEPFHGGFGLLTVYGIPKPSYRAFELLRRLGTERLGVEGTHETVEAWVVRRAHQVTVLLINLALPHHPVQTEQVRVRLAHAPAPRAAYVERIDEDHANPRRTWVEMGQPGYLNHRQVAQLQAASRLVKEPIDWRYEDETIHLDIDLPPNSVAAITVEFAVLACSGN